MNTKAIPVESPKPVCFVIMPISDAPGYDSGHFSRVYEHLLKPAIAQAGFTPVRADDEVKTDYIVVGIIRRIVDSAMVICDFSARNPNVMYELGVRHAFNKPVLLIKDKKTERIFDIQGLRHTEYDDSLRIDSVQKDGERIVAAIRETANADRASLNSVIQLAGIRAAEVPAGQTVSADTQLLLAAIGNLDRRIDSLELDESTVRNFRFEDDRVVFQDSTKATIGDEIFDAGLDSIGNLVDIHPAASKIFLRNSLGKITPYSATSIKSRGLTALPF